MSRKSRVSISSNKRDHSFPLDFRGQYLRDIVMLTVNYVNIHTNHVRYLKTCLRDAQRDGDNKRHSLYAKALNEAKVTGREVEHAGNEAINNWREWYQEAYEKHSQSGFIKVPATWGQTWEDETVRTSPNFTQWRMEDLYPTLDIYGTPVKRHTVTHECVDRSFPNAETLTRLAEIWSGFATNDPIAVSDIDAGFLRAVQNSETTSELHIRGLTVPPQLWRHSAPFVGLYTQPPEVKITGWETPTGPQGRPLVHGYDVIDPVMGKLDSRDDISVEFTGKFELCDKLSPEIKAKLEGEVTGYLLKKYDRMLTITESLHQPEIIELCKQYAREHNCFWNSGIRRMAIDEFFRRHPEQEVIAVTPELDVMPDDATLQERQDNFKRLFVSMDESVATWWERYNTDYDGDTSIIRPEDKE